MKAAVAATLLVILAGGSGFYYVQEQSTRHKVEDELTSIARLKVKQIEEWRLKK